MPAYSITPAERGFSARREDFIVGEENSIDVLEYHDNLKDYFTLRDSGGEVAHDSAESDRAKETEDNFSKKLAKRAQVFLEKKEDGVRPSETVVLKSALYLVQKLGLTPTQIIAFLHFAIWVQSMKIAEWIAADELAGKKIEVDVFQLLILGAGGCGKSAFILVADVFVAF